MNDERLEEIKKYVAARYAHLPQPVQERIFRAYQASAERSSSALLKDRSIDVVSNITSANYKEFLFNDNPR